MFGLLNVRNEIHVLHHCYDQHLLVRVLPRIRVRQNIKETARFKCQNNVLE